MKAEEICEKLRLDHSKVLNIYPYGSKIYGTDDEYSDSDYVIVFKSSLLPSGAFKDNAISSFDREIQGTCYSRAGFIDAINNYEISALECIFLPEEKVIQKNMNFGITKFYEKEFVKKIITKASSSWYFSTLAYRDELIESSIKNIFHALRILDFGLQIKEHKKIVNYSSMNEIKKELDKSYNTFNPYDYYDLFMELQEKLKN
jgi:predicted nuclease of restriction endonuclease-like RecB superfamily